MIIRRKLKISGVICLVLAGLSWVAETSFYGDVDAQGVLQESFFMPLGFILVVLGIAMLAVSVFPTARK